MGHIYPSCKTTPNTLQSIKKRGRIRKCWRIQTHCVLRRCAHIRQRLPYQTHVTPATSFLNCACSFLWQVRQLASTYPATTAATHGPEVHPFWRIFSVCCPRDYRPRWNKGTNIMFCVGAASISCLLQRPCSRKGYSFPSVSAALFLRRSILIFLQQTGHFLLMALCVHWICKTFRSLWMTTYWLAISGCPSALLYSYNPLVTDNSL